MTASNILVNPNRSTYQRIPQLLKRMRRDVFISSKLKPSSKVITVGSLLSRIKPVPSNTILLGECKDGLPFLIQLEDPALGAMLISGDPGCGKTHQLQVMVDSALRLNQPHDLQVSILTHNPDEWRTFWGRDQQEKYLYELMAWYDPNAEKLIETLLQLAVARREGKRQGATILFVLDDFNFVEDLSYAAQVNLHWLIAYGAQSGIWITAAIKTRYAQNYCYWINSFRTRFIGAVTASEDAAILSGRNDLINLGRVSGVFQIWSGSSWLSYRLPLLGD